MNPGWKKFMVSVALAVVFLPAITFSVVWQKGQGMVLFNPRCHVGLALRKPHWKSWRMDYCHGWQYDEKGREVHYYHFPKFSHTDVGALLRQYPIPTNGNKTPK